MLFGKSYLKFKKPSNSLFNEPKELFNSSLFFRDRIFFPSLEKQAVIPGLGNSKLWKDHETRRQKSRYWTLTYHDLGDLCHMTHLLRAFSVTQTLHVAERGLKPEDTPSIEDAIFAITFPLSMPCPDIRKVNSVINENLQDKEKSEKAWVCQRPKAII